MADTVWVDFNNADAKGRIRLNVRGTVESLERQGVILTPGLTLVLDDGDVHVTAVAEYSLEESIWVAVPCWP